MEQDLEAACSKWQRQVVQNGVAREPFLGQRVIASLKERLAAWGSMERASTDWLEKWAGKEVLKLIRQQLAARFETPVHTKQSDGRIPPVKWHAFPNNSKRNEMDRDIERALQPELVRQLWENCVAFAESPIRTSLTSLRALLAKQ